MKGWTLVIPRPGVSLQEGPLAWWYFSSIVGSWPVVVVTRNEIVWGRVLELVHWSDCRRHLIQWYEPEGRFLSLLFPFCLLSVRMRLSWTFACLTETPGWLVPPCALSWVTHLALEHIHGCVTDLSVDGQWLCSSDFISEFKRWAVRP